MNQSMSTNNRHTMNGFPTRTFDDREARIIVFLAFAAGILARIYIATHTAIINLDGIIYINQARAIAEGRWTELFVSLNYLPLNSLLIVPIHWIVPDWAAAGQALSMICGIGLLVPVYLSLREFYPRRTSGVALVLFALSPTLVSRSNDILKDAQAWFFLSMAIWFLVRHYRGRQTENLLAGGVFFLLAAWCRNEILAIYLAAAAALPLSAPDRRSRRLTAFLAPAATAAAAVFLAAVASGWRPDCLMRAHEVTAAGVLSSYHRLRDYLAGLAASMRFSDFHTYSFLTEARSYAWALPVIIIVSKLSEAAFPLYLLVWIIGLVWARGRKPDRRLLPFKAMAAAALIVLYWQVIRTWVMEYRYTVILALAMLPWAGAGVEAVVGYMEKNWPRLKPYCAAGLAVVLIVPGMVKNIRPKMYDKAVYRNIGEQCAPLRPGEFAATSDSPAARWVFFYATRKSQEPRPPAEETTHIPPAALKSPQTLAAAMRKNGSTIFLAEESDLSRLGTGWRDFSGADLKKLGEWRQNDSGRLALYRLREHRP